MAGCRHQSQRNVKHWQPIAKNKQETKVVFAFPQVLTFFGDSVQIDQIYHLRRQFSLTLTLSNIYHCKCILLPQNDFGMQTNLVNRHKY